MAQHTVEELLFHMPTVQRHAGSEWARGFAASIHRQSRRRGWRPSDKQLAIMRRLVSETFTEDTDPTLIEEDAF